MLSKLKENLFKWWISVNTSALVCPEGWCYRHTENNLYYGHAFGIYASIDLYPVAITDKAPETKQQFVNAVYKHLTDGTTN